MTNVRERREAKITKETEFKMKFEVATFQVVDILIKVSNLHNRINHRFNLVLGY